MLASLFLLLLGGPQPEIELGGDDVVIEKSVKVKPGLYRIEDLNDDGIVHVKGDGLTLDFTGVTIAGSGEKAAADQFKGRGLVARGCRNLTIKGLSVRGVKIGMYFKDCDGLTLSGCDVSGNWRQHLKSTPRGEDGADWLFGHENDQNEWFRYGAGIYIEDSRGVTVSRCRARNGQNGLCLKGVNDSFIIDNDLSFMSGWGLALWRSSRNDISNNKFDWCIRGFSYRVYHRGQDSTGILVYEQSSDNVFAYNSATHGGDGFFLYAGNETLHRTGAGGCNRNLLYKNDFSHAAANGIEATFSDGNLFLENRLDECDHGVWGGYSYNTVIAGNTLRDCQNGISIEHGHSNRIESNTFERCGIGVHAWGGENPSFAKTPYGRKQDTASHGYTIARNTWKDTKVAIALEATSEVNLVENAIEAQVALRADGRCRDLKADSIAGKIMGAPVSPGFAPVEKYRPSIPRTRGSQDAYLPPGTLRGLRAIFVDDWGPYDFKSLRLFPSDVAAWGSAEMYLLGPDRKFTVSGVTEGIQVSPMEGRLPATLKVTAPAGGARQFSFQVTGGPETARATGILLFATWEVKFFGWEDQGPQKPPREWEAVIGSKPLDSMTLDRIDFLWGTGRPSDKVPPDHFATLATTVMELPAGRYEVRTVSDDGVRLWIDEKPVIDNWTWHPPHEDRAEITLEKGKHPVRLEHFEIDGVAQLQMVLRPIR
jgi:parallel beta-helix repeat protein